MEIAVKALAAELQWCQRFIEKKTTIPILSNVLFDAGGSQLKLISTDLELGAITGVAGVGRDKWSVAVPVGKLIKYLGKVDEPEVTLTTAENHWLTVKHGTSMTRIAGMSRESFPELPTPPKESITLGRFSQAIGRVEFAISKEESRFTLNGALLEAEGDEARLIATDGHRLSLAPVQVKGAPKTRALIMEKALLEAAKLGDTCQFSADDDHVFLNYGQRLIIVRKLKGTFPDYTRVLIKDFFGHVIIPVASTLKTLNRVALYADERSHAVKFTIGDGKLTIFASSVETGEAEGTVPCQGGDMAVPLEVGYNAEYITDFLSRTDVQNVAFVWQDEKSGAQFVTGDGWRMCLMPMRL